MRSLLLLLISCLSLAAWPLATAASTLIYNVHGYTMNNGERIDFVALEHDGGMVKRVYQSAASAENSGATTRIDGRGATLLPGLIDVHGHVRRYGAGLASVDLSGSTSEAFAAARIAAFLGSGAAGSEGWVEGWGWNQVLWPGQEFPTRAALDAVERERPIVMRRVDGHALWVNSAALAAAGINRDTPDPDGGQILRDAAGEPTGVLIDNAMRLVGAAQGEATLAQLEADIERSLTSLAQKGLTAVQDAGTTAGEHVAFRNLFAKGRMPIRSHVMLKAIDPGNERQLEEGPYRTGDGLLSVRSVKISTDGALGSRGAALHEDYSDQPGHRGLLLMSEDVLFDIMQRSAEVGFQVNVHAIGDRANTLVLDNFAKLSPDYSARVLRHRIEHAQILRREDIARFAELDVIASIEPTHATSDKNMAGDRLGEARLEGAYAWKTLLDSGARLAGGSDFPVEPPDPLYGLHAAVTRQDRNGEPLGGWLPGEKLSREEALSLFTEWAAYAIHEENRLGKLLPGYSADFVLVEDDYFEQPEGSIWSNRVLATVVAGRVVFAGEGSPLALD